ncbi:uncharacterized protein LOC135385547 [Ornithodoros turicata]|uniref:uncharacterized protein LOC135385547 n=1 Tax=Ornithodoros turicata TaxID=34597 RepID=UPI00313954A4
MNTTVFIFLFAVVLAGVLSTSPPNCEHVVCAQVKCAAVDCACGSYKGACGCCDICYKCTGETCVPLHQDRCVSDERCILKEDADIHQGASGVCGLKGSRYPPPVRPVHSADQHKDHHPSHHAGHSGDHHTSHHAGHSGDHHKDHHSEHN